MAIGFVNRDESNPACPASYDLCITTERLPSILTGSTQATGQSDAPSTRSRCCRHARHLPCNSDQALSEGRVVLETAPARSVSHESPARARANEGLDDGVWKGRAPIEYRFTTDTHPRDISVIMAWFLSQKWLWRQVSLGLVDTQRKGSKNGRIHQQGV